MLGKLQVRARYLLENVLEYHPARVGLNVACPSDLVIKLCVDNHHAAKSVNILV